MAVGISRPATSSFFCCVQKCRIKQWHVSSNDLVFEASFSF